jgi:hypothetical protein
MWLRVACALAVIFGDSFRQCFLACPLLVEQVGVRNINASWRLEHYKLDLPKSTAIRVDLLYILVVCLDTVAKGN